MVCWLLNERFCIVIIGCIDCMLPTWRPADAPWCFHAEEDSSLLHAAFTTFASSSTRASRRLRGIVISESSTENKVDDSLKSVTASA